MLTLIQAPFAAILPTTGTPGQVVKWILVVLTLGPPVGLGMMATILDQRRHISSLPRVWYWYRRILAGAVLEALFILLVVYLVSPRPPTGGEVVWFLAVGFALGLVVGGGTLNWDYLSYFDGPFARGFSHESTALITPTKWRLIGAIIGPSLAGVLVALALTATGIVR